jgi:hypothetical protein
MNKITVEIDADILNAIRRKLSFRENRDLTNQETVDLIVEFFHNKTAPKERKAHYNAGHQEVKKLILDGATSTEAVKNLGCSKSTFFRIKAKEKLKAEQSQ